MGCNDGGCAFSNSNKVSFFLIIDGILGSCLQYAVSTNEPRVRSKCHTVYAIAGTVTVLGVM